MKKYIDEIMPTSPKTTMQFSGNVGNSKISEASFRALGLKIPRWFAAEEYEKPAGSTQASLWMSHAGGASAPLFVCCKCIHVPPTRRAFHSVSLFLLSRVVVPVYVPVPVPAPVAVEAAVAVETVLHESFLCMSL